MTPPRTPAPCHHELRPGTKVCLHCRRAEREATSARHRAILVRIGITGAIVAAVAYAGVAGYAAWKERSTAGVGRLIASPSSLEAAPAPVAVAATPPVAEPASNPLGESTLALQAPPSASEPGTVATAALATPVSLVGARSFAPAPSTASAPAASPALQPVIAEGRTELQDGMYAIRSGDTVTVHFDTPEARTRRPEKFEQIVRATLPGVHGAAAESILATVATGNLLGSVDLASEEPPRAISLRGATGQSLSLLPQTRPGRDGPLVVSYRVIARR